MVAGALCLAPHGLSSTRQHCCLPQEARPIPAWPLRGPAGAGLCEAPCCSGRAACCAGRPRPGSRRARLPALPAAASSGAARQPCVLYDLHDRQARAGRRKRPTCAAATEGCAVPPTQTAYVRAWDWQKALVKRRLAALQAGRPAADELLLLQHPPVYTLGTGSTLANLRFDPGQPPFELHRTERGGEATYHGPGQLVVYPILDLRCAFCRHCVNATRWRLLCELTPARAQAAPGGPALVHALAGGGVHQDACGAGFARYAQLTDAYVHSRPASLLL